MVNVKYLRRVISYYCNGKTKDVVYCFEDRTLTFGFDIEGNLKSQIHRKNGLLHYENGPACKLYYNNIVFYQLYYIHGQPFYKNITESSYVKNPVEIRRVSYVNLEEMLFKQHTALSVIEKCI